MVDLLVILVILAAVVLFVSAPLRRATDVAGALDAAADGSPPASELAELEAARDAKLRELRDAELDHRTGKLSDEDFASVDGSLRREAIEILRALDEARDSEASGGHSDAPGGEQDAATISD